MINVELTPFGRQLLGVTLSAIAYKANLMQKNVEAVKKKQAVLMENKKEVELWQEMSYNTTIGMIDRRFKESKHFVNTGDASGGLRFKKSLSENERKLQFITEQNMKKIRTKYESQVSNYNKMIIDKKMQAAVKTLDIRSL